MDSQSTEATETQTNGEIVKEEISAVETTHHEIVKEQPKEDHDRKDHDRKDHDRKDHDRKDHDRKDHDRKDHDLTNTSGSPPSILPKQDLATNKILYYFRHPEETPPPIIKNMVKLLQLMKEDEENPKEDESSDIFYSSDESVEDSSDEEEEKTLHVKSSTPLGRSNMISLTKHGLRFPNGYFSHFLLQHVEAAVVQPTGSGKSLHVILRDHDDLKISLPIGFDANTVLTAIEQWISMYKKILK